MQNSDIIASCALIIAIISVLVAMRQLDIQHKHNKKSLKPIGYIDVGDFEDNLFAKISNYGLGPLIIQKVEVQKGEQIENNLIIFFPELHKDKHYNNFVVELGDKIITPNNNISFNDEDSELRNEFRSILKDINVKVQCKSVYDECFSFERKLNWFNRNL